MVDDVTALVVTAKLEAKLPAFTTTLAGTIANELSLDNPTVTPPTGAAPLKVTVPVVEVPPVTDTGFSMTDVSVTPCPALRYRV